MCHRVLKNTKMNVVKRKINVFTKFLKENNPETMPDSPVEHLRNMIFHLIVILFPTTFMLCSQINMKSWSLFISVFILYIYRTTIPTVKKLINICIQYEFIPIHVSKSITKRFKYDICVVQYMHVYIYMLLPMHTVVDLRFKKENN